MKKSGLMCGWAICVVCFVFSLTATAEDPTRPYIVHDIDATAMDNPLLRQALALKKTGRLHEMSPSTTPSMGFYDALEVCPNPACTSSDWSTDWKDWEMQPMVDTSRVVCKHCGTFYPNENYPADQIETFITHTGVAVHEPFHLGANGTKYFFSAAAGKYKHSWGRKVMEAAASAYVETGDEAYAELHRDIMVDWSKKSTHWVMFITDAGSGSTTRKKVLYSSPYGEGNPLPLPASLGTSLLTWTQLGTGIMLTAETTALRI